MEKDAQRPLLSVIVPVYRVEQYLHKCLDSLVDQTYRNLEIILVDDGSPDSCGAICDAYAARDERIRVIHQENSGGSGARNTGLDHARGEFVAFVDSDDYLEKDMYAQLVVAAVGESADIVIGDFYMILETGISRRYSRMSVDTPLRQVQEMVLADRIPSYLWNKIYRRSLFDGIRFERIRGFEDLLVTPRLFQRAKKVVYVPHAGYYYNCMNMGALTAVFNHRPELNVEMKFGLFAAWKEHETVAREMGSDVADYAESRALKSAVSALVGDVAHDVLTPSQRQALAHYLERKRTVKIGRKYRWLRWSAAHSPLMCRLYDYGSFVWRRYKAKKDKLQE